MTLDRNVTKIAIIDGKKIHFDMISQEKEHPDLPHFHLLGKGTVYQTGADVYKDGEGKEGYFFVNTKKNNREALQIRGHDTRAVATIDNKDKVPHGMSKSFHHLKSIQRRSKRV